MLQHELQERSIRSRALQPARADARGRRAEIEASVLRKFGSDGVVVMATVAPCRLRSW